MGDKNAIVHSYKNGFSGFAARLSEAEAHSVAQRPGVVSIFPDLVLQLCTTRSWDFLKCQTGEEINLSPSSGFDSSADGADTIIGILDTGIWLESESFNDNDVGPIPARWNGTCMDGHDFGSSKCNKFYEVNGTARDKNGHGTHVASTAAGSPVVGASYYGLAAGTAKGGSTGSKITMYNVCTAFGCNGSAIIEAFDDANADGVDVLSLPLGSSSGLEPEFSSNPIGIIVVFSAGNGGPSPKTIVNIAPWILTVAATTIDRDFEIHVLWAGNKLIKLIYWCFRGCIPGSLDENKVKGKIVLCENLDDGEYSPSDRIDEVKRHGGVGFILIDDKSEKQWHQNSNPSQVLQSLEMMVLRSSPTSTQQGTIFARSLINLDRDSIRLSDSFKDKCENT
ncbi:hypothetical protein K7X08_001080 [Anisodus acutangulus]|uniref:Uncharacterized protein n=1 Tax=Anisodus acutangulus TaxID=402998 RepID=A0A9Q1RK94_9SOLA|nr:hypothetical protein K7X08_001080 [Anisodus acutangulus]